MKTKKVILVDNKQSIDPGYRLPRYALWHEYFLEIGLNSEIILSNWSHSKKKRLTCPSIQDVRCISTLAYRRNKSIARFLSEVFFAFQLLPQLWANRKSNALYVFNDSGYIYLQLLLPIIRKLGQDYCIDSNDLWPEIFGKNWLVNFFTKRKFELFKKARFLLAVNKTYFDYYERLHLPGRVIHLTLLQSEIQKINSIYSQRSDKALYLGSLGVNYNLQSLSKVLSINDVKEVHLYSKVDFKTQNDMKNEMGCLELKFFDPDSLENISNNNYTYKFGISSYSNNSLVEFPTKFIDYGYMGLPILSNTFHSAVANCDFFDTKEYSENYIYRMNRMIGLGEELEELMKLL